MTRLALTWRVLLGPLPARAKARKLRCLWSGRPAEARARGPAVAVK